jgi:hypothetical protein
MASAAFAGPSVVHPSPWRVSAIEGRRTITVSVSTGACVGFPHPEIDRVEVSAPGSRLYQKQRVLITVFEREAIPPVVIEDNVGPGMIRVCAGIGMLLKTRVRLPHPVHASALFDGSSDPPPRRAICEPPPPPPETKSRGPIGVAAAVPVCWHWF